MGLVSGLSLANHFDSKVLPGGARLVQPRWMPERRILGGGWTGGISFWPFPNSSGWQRLISSLSLTRTSCHKTTHASGYYGAGPGWEVSISVLPLTELSAAFSSSVMDCGTHMAMWQSHKTKEALVADSAALESCPTSSETSRLGPGTLCSGAAVLASGQASPWATKYKETIWD